MKPTSNIPALQIIIVPEAPPVKPAPPPFAHAAEVDEAVRAAIPVPLPPLGVA